MRWVSSDDMARLFSVGFTLITARFKQMGFHKPYGSLTSLGFLSFTGSLLHDGFLNDFLARFFL